MAVSIFRGDIKKVIQGNREFLEMFDPPQRQKFFALNLRDALDWWRFTYLRRRIEAKSVRRPPFNYKRGGRSPMVHTGELISKIATGKISVSKPRGSKDFLPFKAAVSLPFGHPVIREISKVFRVGAGGMLPGELQEVANRLAQNIAKESRGVKVVNRKNKLTGQRRPRYQLSPGQRQAYTEKKSRSLTFESRYSRR